MFDNKKRRHDVAINIFWNKKCKALKEAKNTSTSDEKMKTKN